MPPAWCFALKICAGLPISRTSRRPTMPSPESRPATPSPFRPTLNHAPLAPVRSIAITGGTGGVGKPNLSVNLAASLPAPGQRTPPPDAALGHAHLALLLGPSPLPTPAHL